MKGVVDVWNSLPEEFREAKNFHESKGWLNNLRGRENIVIYPIQEDQIQLRKAHSCKLIPVRTNTGKDCVVTLFSLFPRQVFMAPAADGILGAKGRLQASSGQTVEDDPALGMWQICCSVGRCPIAARIGEQAQGWETVCLTQLTVGTEFSKSLSSISDAWV